MCRGRQICQGSLIDSRYLIEMLEILKTNNSEVQNDHCTPPSSCCPGSLDECQFSEAFVEGCVQKAMHYLNDKTGTIVGIWALVWIFMLFELFSIKHTVRRISLSKKWHEGTTHYFMYRL